MVSVWGVSRNIKHKAIIEERQKWRDSLRQLIRELVSQPDRSARERTRDSIVLRLNPYKDADAVALIDRFVTAPSESGRLEIVDRFQDMQESPAWCGAGQSSEGSSRQQFVGTRATRT